jgi:hypothetical protein
MHADPIVWPLMAAAHWRLWLAAFGLACVPFVLALVDRLIGVIKRGWH